MTLELSGLTEFALDGAHCIASTTEGDSELDSLYCLLPDCGEPYMLSK
jgi:hypothetical protein